MEQADLDLLAAKAQERKARITVAISAEQVEIAKAGVVVAQKLVADVEKLIAAKQQEIEDANSIFNQFKDYFSGHEVERQLAGGRREGRLGGLHGSELQQRGRARWVSARAAVPARAQARALSLPGWAAPRADSPWSVGSPRSRC